MGFRSTLTTNHDGFDIPQWFKDKYVDLLYCNNLPLAAKCEFKQYSERGQELPLDIQKMLPDKYSGNFILIWLHECGGITRVQISKNKIIISEPSEWDIVEDVMHHYCYSCSDN